MAKNENNEVVKPLIIKVNDGKDVTEYTLEFDRESVKFAESRGFSTGDIERYPMTKIPELFFYAFRMHHKNVSREKTDKILFDPDRGFGGIGNLPDGMLERLGQLYAAPFTSLSKNSAVTVEL